MTKNKFDAVPIAESYRGVMPFLIADTIRALLILLVPSISLFVLQFMK
jgi:C4-dicarboxylate transporter DctM subunit